ncbi:MAG TPA: DUF2115 domain-containing protein [Methanospirillum sp.]|nr:DUF2115 domain-containing protein [Methanospirillum sp.]
MGIFGFTSHRREAQAPGTIRGICDILTSARTRGDLGIAITANVFTYSPRDLDLMRWNFSEKIRDYNSDYRKSLEETITAYLHGTYQKMRLMHQQGSFPPMTDPVPDDAPEYWAMVADHCTTGDDQGDRLRFLKFLLSGFCMLVQRIPGHPVGMVFPGGDKVEMIDGVFYCPVRTKANDVDAALCPFCPALQTPDIGYLKPPVNASRHRKQEFIKDCYDHHHFNG